MSCPTILFCVGAAKAGTSWLHGYLAGHPDCHFRVIKELHYFDALDTGKRDRPIDQHRTLRDGFRARLAKSQGDADRLRRQIDDRGDWLRVLERPEEDTGAYLDYLTTGAGQARLVGDVTPAYALLSEDRLRRMAAIAPDVRFVYLLRDPVERLWSHVRMISARRSPEGTVIRRRTDRIFNRTLRGEESEIARRGDYRAAMEKLARAVDPARLKIAFYEELFDGSGVRALCDFLGLSWQAANTSQRVHAGQPLEILPEQRRIARHWLAPQYDYVAGTMGRLPEAWQADIARV